MASKASREASFRRGNAAIEAFCKQYDIKAVRFNDGYQIRLEGVLDLYPVNRKWHNLKTQARGVWFDSDDLRRIMLKAIEVKVPPIIADGHISPRQPMQFVPRPYQKEVMDRVLRMSPEERAKGLQWGRPRYVAGVDFAAPGSTDKTVVSTMKLNGSGEITKIWFDEFAEWPSYKWWRNPIKWIKWRRTMKLIDSSQAKYNNRKEK